MKMSSVFKLPLPKEYTKTLWQSDTKAIELAVNNHDALTLAVSDLLYLSAILKHKMRNEKKFPEAYQLRIDQAKNLLDKIDGK